MPLLVLVIEDSPTDALLLERELRRGGYDPVVERVETRAALTAALPRRPWDVVISDYSLPGWSGTDALVIVKESSADLPFILVSGMIGEEIAVQAIKAGANDYLLKDRLARLPAAIARALEEAELRRDRRRSRAALAFLARASARLFESLNEVAVAETLVALAVPLLGDYAVVDLVADPGTLRRVAISAPSAATDEAARTAMDDGVALDASTNRLAHEALHRLELVLEEGIGVSGRPGLSLLALPLAARSDALGVLTLAVSSPPRSFVAADVALAEELAGRANVAFDNARLYREAQEAIAAREDFLLLASHELKTPLTPLLLQVQALLHASSTATPASAPPTLRKGLDATLRHVQRLGRLVDQLLDVSSLGADRLELTRERLDLAAFAGEVAQGFTPQAADAGCPLVVETRGPVWGHWDRTRIGQVLGNLLNNAFKFGAGKPVELLVEQQGKNARVQVRDGGQGISSADRARIFARFERAVSVRRYGGFGLGLWVARQVVEAHGGTIEVASEPNEGATFIVELPAE